MRWVFIAFLLTSVAVGSADTIRLKNGKSIANAENVRERDGGIEYEIGDNSYRIPKSLVVGIDRAVADGEISDLSASAAAARPDPDEAASLPPIPSNQEIRIPKTELGKIIHDGKVDLDALDALESAGNSEATAAGYFVAGEYAFQQGERESARRFFERALNWSPDNAIILSHYASLLVQVGRAREAIGYAVRATQSAPDSADAYAILGYAYFVSDRTRDAIPAWEKSLSLHYDKKLEEYLARAKREMAAEANFTERETGRFTIRYEGAATGDTLRHQIISVLDKDYDELSIELGITPYQNIPVILYTERAFFDVTQAPTWTGALNDGKLRIPVQGMSSVTPELARVLKHELAHSFINQASAGRCPQWLNEGIAQLVENRPFRTRGEWLAQLYKEGKQVPLSSLEKSFLGYSRANAILAYDESLAAAMFIRDNYGADDLRRLLEHLSQGGSTEDALKDVLRIDYPRFESDLADYLAAKYGS